MEIILLHKWRDYDADGDHIHIILLLKLSLSYSALLSLITHHMDFFYSFGIA